MKAILKSASWLVDSPVNVAEPVLKECNKTVRLESWFIYNFFGIGNRAVDGARGNKK
jgi:hypothetical protein